MKVKLLILVLVFISGIVYAGNKAPVAVLTSDSPKAHFQAVTLDGSASYDPEAGGEILRYNWDFTNDGTTDYSETASVHPDSSFDGITTHIYGAPDTYTAKLTVLDNDNMGGDDTCLVVIHFPQVILISKNSALTWLRIRA